MSDHGYMDDIGGAGATTGITLTGFLIGAVFGAGIALLLAPGPGSETRRKVGEAARKLGTVANDAMNNVREGDMPFSTGGRREPMPGARTPTPGTSGASS